MSGWFNRLPGFQKTPAGDERRVLRLLPALLVYGSLLLAVPSLLLRGLGYLRPDLAADLPVMTVDIYAIGLIILHWTIVLTVGIGAFIIMVMKGPAYVADAYQVDERDSPVQ